MKNHLSNLFCEYLESINFKDNSIVEVLKTKETKFGDYTSNIPLKISKQLSKDPMDLAEDIKFFLLKNKKNHFSNITITKPGFINMFLSNNLILEGSISFLQKNYKPPFSSIKKLNINYEYISANPTGELHIGHARNAIVGGIVINILRYIGHNVFTEYYINDGGKQINLLAESIYFYYAKISGIKTSLEKEIIGYHGKEIISYAEKLSKENYKIIGKEKEEIKKLEKKSSDYFLNIIKNLLIEMRLPNFDKWTSEKQLLEEETKQLFEELKNKKLIYEKDGATWIKVSNFGDEKDRVLIKSDGSYTYLFADIINHINKAKRGFDLIIDLWGKDHHGYEPRIQATMKAFGFEKKLEIDYISMVQIINGKEIVKMSKRSGTSLRISDILKEVDQDVFKYFIVSKNKEQEMEIDINIASQKNLSNPFYYIQYANARIFQILEKYKETNSNIDILKKFVKLGKEEKERDLMIKMLEFEDIIISINNEREPSLIINYFKELAQTFNSYYSVCRVVSEDKELTMERINLIFALNNQFKTIFNLIGINPINKI